MDHAALVRRAERPGHVGADPRRLVGRQRPLAPEPIGKRLALDEFHDDERRLAVATAVVDGDDVRMVEPGRGMGLAPEPLDEALITVVGLGQ
jgi:hypothetical protein